MRTVRLKREEVFLVAIDFQEKLMPAMHEKEKVEENAVRLCKGLKTLNVPIIVTQQYTKGLGNTVEPVAQAIGEYEPIDKTSFSAAGEEAFLNKLKEIGRKTALICGVEAHICVEQTCLDLLEMGYNVVLVGDCIESRNPINRTLSIERVRQAGGIVTGYESVLYELLGGAKAPEFKEISKIVK